MWERGLGDDEVARVAGEATSEGPGRAGVLAGVRVALTGRMASMSRREYQGLIRARGGVPVDAVSERTGMLVVGMFGWPLLSDGRVTDKLHKAERLQAKGARIEILSEHAFLERMGVREPMERLEKQHPAAAVCGLLGIDEAMLRRWDQLGLVRSARGRYDFQDLVSLRTIAELVREGVSPGTIQRSIRELARVLPGTERPLTQLKIVAENPRRLLAELGETLLAPDGQLLMRFDRGGGELPAAIAMPGGRERTAGEWLEAGLAREEAGDLEGALEAYRGATGAEPKSAEAQFNLGNVLLALGRAEGAAERFWQAAALDPALAAARYNLALALEELGRVKDALAVLEELVERDPGYADARFNLAAMYEELGRRGEAREQWEAYARLDPGGPWGAAARERLR